MTNQAPPHMNDEEIVNFQEDERVYLHNLNKEISSSFSRFELHNSLPESRDVLQGVTHATSSQGLLVFR